MKRIFLLVMCIALSGLAGCDDPDRYPISGQECSPDDPVMDLDPSGCTPPV